MSGRTEFYFVQNSEDGVRISGPYDHGPALKHINDIAGPERSPEYRAQWVTVPPDEYSDVRHVLVIKGEVVIPQENKTVVEWGL